MQLIIEFTKLTVEINTNITLEIMYIIKVKRPPKSYGERKPVIDGMVEDERLSESPELTKGLKEKGWEKISHRKAIEGKDYDFIAPEIFNI